MSSSLLYSYPYIIEGKVSSFSIALGMALASQTSAAFSLFHGGLVWLFLSFIQCQFILSYVRGAQESKGRDWIPWSWSQRHTDPMWLLGIKPGSSIRALYVLHH